MIKLRNTCFSLIGSRPIALPVKTLSFFQKQVPAITSQRGQFIDFGAAWVVDADFLTLNGDFNYFPPGKKGEKTPLLDPNMYVAPRPARKGQNYVVARESSIGDKPLVSIAREVRLFRVSDSYQKGKAMLVYSFFSPSEKNIFTICKMIKDVGLPTLMTYSYARKDVLKVSADLRRCGARLVHLPENVMMKNNYERAIMGTTMPNIDYLVRGYNILYGNPISSPSTGTDPGIRIFPTFVTNYDSGMITSDGKWAVPDGLFFIITISCVIEFNSEESRSSSSYMNSLTNEVSADGKYFGAYFKANVKVSSKIEELHEASYSYVKSQAVCSYYKGSIFPDLPPRLTPQILATMKKCSDNPTDDNFKNLVELFGTHYIAHGVMGSKFGSESKLSTEKYEELQKNGINVGTAAGFEGRFSAGFQQETDSQREQREAFENARESKFSYTYGTQMPADGSPGTWASQTSQTPMLINIELTSISELLTDTFKTDLDEKQIDYEMLRPKLVKYLTRYCQQLVDENKAKDCMPPTGK